MAPLQAIPYITAVQLTDSHLYAELDSRLLGMQTQDSLQKVMQLVAEEQEQIDLLLCTGDISQDGSAQSYQRFAEMIDGMAVNTRWFAGNHDEAAALQAASLGDDWLEPVCDLGAWRIITLDSSVKDEVHGYLDKTQLSILKDALRSAADRHVLIALHHHPLPIHSQWMDKISLLNAAELLAILGDFNNVKAVIWGHVHQEYDEQQQGIRWLAAPSTCIQFKPLEAEFTVDEQAPGYRWLRLYDDGQLQTAVSRVDHYDFEIDYSSNGY